MYFRDFSLLHKVTNCYAHEMNDSVNALIKKFSLTQMELSKDA